MDFIDSVIMTRASVRSFSGGAIPRETLVRIAKAGMAAPSAVDLRPWAIILVTDRAKLDELGSALPYAKMLDKAAAAFVVCGDPGRDERIAPRHWAVDCAAMTENILLAVHSLGLGGVWTAVHPDEGRLGVVRRILGIPTGIVPLNVIPVGVIAGKAPPPKDKYRPEDLHFDAW
jgi:nitroreductase